MTWVALKAWRNAHGVLAILPSTKTLSKPCNAPKKQCLLLTTLKNIVFFFQKQPKEANQAIFKPKRNHTTNKARASQKTASASTAKGSKKHWNPIFNLDYWKWYRMHQESLQFQTPLRDSDETSSHNENGGGILLPHLYFAIAHTHEDNPTRISYENDYDYKPW